MIRARVLRGGEPVNLEVDLGAGGDDVDAVVAIAAGRRDGGIVVGDARIIEEEADIIGRDPGQAGLERVLGAAGDAVRIEVEMVVAQVELDRAEAAARFDRAADRGAVPARAL